jgi:hypothetical protein
MRNKDRSRDVAVFLFIDVNCFMKTMFWIILLNAGCKGFINTKMYVSKPELQPLDNYSKRNFDESFFHEEHYGLYNSFPDSIEKQHPFTTETVVLVDTNKYYLTNCDAELKADSLVLSFSSSPFSISQIGFNIIKRNTNLYVQYNDLYVLTDSAFKLADYKPLSQNIFLEHEHYEPGEILKGKLSLKVIRTQLIGENKYIDTANIYGLIKTVVK